MRNAHSSVMVRRFATAPGSGPASCRVAIALFAFAALSGAAHAAAARFVATTGSDANSCTRALPCRSLQRALQAVPIGGEIQILDSGLYIEPLTITKSVTIAGRGVSATLANVVVDTAGVVVLDTLLFNGKNSGPIGIFIDDAERVAVEHCLIEKFSGNGIAVDAPAEIVISDTVSRHNGGHGLSATDNGEDTSLTILDSIFSSNGGSGISIAGTAATIAGTSASGNGVHGITASASRMNISHSVAAMNTAHGFFMLGASELSLEFSEAYANLNGLRVNAGGTAYISSNVIMQNTIGVNNLGTTNTRFSNIIDLNTTDVAGTGPFVPYFAQ